MVVRKSISPKKHVRRETSKIGLLDLRELRRRVRKIKKQKSGLYKRRKRT